ncbi:hypothetical protein [Deinococcus sp.]|uniref:hypothetical protein n=1 Tax=Deinococcus sp. TaxID=47478 RepID=UPI003C7A9242
MSQASYTTAGLDQIMSEVHLRLRRLAEVVGAGNGEPTSLWSVALNSILFVYQDVEAEAREHRDRLPALLESPEIDVMLDAFRLLGALIERFGHIQMSLGALLELHTADGVQSRA